MQRFNKNRRRALGRMLCCALALACLSAAPARAQADYQKYLSCFRSISGQLNAATLSYRYRVVLQERDKGQNTDSISGVLYKVQDNFLDSSSRGLSMVGDGFFFKADKSRQQAFLYRLETVQKKLGLKKEDMDASILTLPDSLIYRAGTLYSTHEEGELRLRYVLKEPMNGIQELFFRIDPGNMSLKQIRITALDEGKQGTRPGYTRIYYLSDFSNAVDHRKMKIDAYVRIANGKATPLGTYQSFKLNSLL